MVPVSVKSHLIHAWTATKFLLTFWAAMYGIAGHALLQLKVHVLACTIEDTVI